MANPVLGNNVLMYITGISADVLFACARSNSLESSMSLKEVTGYNSNKYREYKPDLNSMTMSVEGLMILKDYSYLLLWQLQDAQAQITVKFSVDNGADGFVVWTTYGYITSLKLDSPYSEVATYSCSLQMTGKPTASGVSPINTNPVNELEYTGTGGETSFILAGLVLANKLLYFSRGGMDQGAILTTGTPSNNDILFDSTLGKITLATTAPLGAGEFCRILYR